MMKSKYELALHKEVPELRMMQCQLNWIQKLFPFLEVSTFHNVDTVEEYFRRLIKEDVQNKRNEFGLNADGSDLDMDLVEGTEDCHSTFGVLGNLLNIVTIHSYLKDFEEANKIMVEVRKIIQAFSDKDALKMQDGHLSAIKYCVAAAEWQIKLLTHLQQPINEGDAEIKSSRLPLDIASERKGLESSWEKLVWNKQFRATIEFFKGSLGASLRIRHEEILNRFEQAIIYDEEFYVWHHFAYQRARIMRRSCYMRGQRFHGPDAREADHCENAYLLAPKELLTQLDFALFLKEDMWFLPVDAWKKSKKQILQCIEIFEMVLHDVNDSTRRDKNRMRVLTTMYYAEFLLFGKHDKLLDRTKGKEMLEGCLAEFPKSSTILHKVAKMYHRIDMFKDLGKAKGAYVRALESAPNNYPCLMDYLKLLKEEEKYLKLIRVIDDYLKILVRDKNRANLFIERGYIGWLFNPLQNRSHKRIACKNWIFVLVNFKDSAREVYNLFKKPYSPTTKDRLHEHKLEVIEELETQFDVLKEDEQIAVQKFLDVLKGEKQDKSMNEDDWNGNSNLVIKNSKAGGRMAKIRVSSRNLFGKLKNVKLFMLVNDPDRFFRAKKSQSLPTLKAQIPIPRRANHIKVPTKRQRKTSLAATGIDWVETFLN